jgi:hypothetical protein
LASHNGLQSSEAGCGVVYLPYNCEIFYVLFLQESIVISAGLETQQIKLAL